MSDELKQLKPCPFCSGEAARRRDGRFKRRQFQKVSYYVVCTDCNAGTDTVASKAEAIAAWNRRAPEPMTSVVKWTRFNGTEETLPPIYEKVLLKDANSFARIPMTGQGRRGDKWFFEDDTQREIEIGDEWAFWPAPPEGME